MGNYTWCSSTKCPWLPQPRLADGVLDDVDRIPIETFGKWIACLDIYCYVLVCLNMFYAVMNVFVLSHQTRFFKTAIRLILD